MILVPKNHPKNLSESILNKIPGKFWKIERAEVLRAFGDKKEANISEKKGDCLHKPILPKR
jgi:hypothetical protein